MRIVVCCLGLALLLGACGGSAAADTPEGTFESMRDAAVSGDWGAVYDLMSEQAQGQVGEQIDRMKQYPEPVRKQTCESLGVSAEELDSMSARDFFAKMMEKSLPAEEVEKIKSAKIVDTNVEGDKAVLKFETDGEQQTLQLVKKDGKWYIDEM
jgi:hypothetical protein